MSAAPADFARRPPPRPPREPARPLPLPALAGVPAARPSDAAASPGAQGPAWVKAPPPRYHLEAASPLVEKEGRQAQAQAPGPAGTSAIRCPKCKSTFAWSAARPTKVECPHCGVKGLVR